MSRPSTVLGLVLASLAIVAAWLLFAHETPHDAAAQRDGQIPSARSDAASRVRDLEVDPSVRSDAAQAPAHVSSSPLATEIALAEWQVRVVDEHGADSPKATVLVLEPSGASWSSTTDERGRVSAAEADGEALVFVAALGRPLELFRLSRAPGEHVVGLSRGFTALAGIATVNSGAPPTSLVLVFEPRRAPFAELELPDELRRKLDAAARLSARTDESGRFYVAGAPLDWSGDALAPRGHVVRRTSPQDQPQRRIALERASSRLVLEFERLPHLVGRVVDASGAPAPQGAPLRASIHSKSRNSTSIVSAELDSDGRFEIPLREARVDKLELQVACDSGQLALEFTGDELQLDACGDLDAGTLVLAPRAVLRVRALDADGLALPGAKARVLGDHVWSETDLNGECAVSSAVVGAATLNVIAVGCWAAKTPVQLPTDEVVEVRLQRGNRLELELVDPARAPLQQVLVRLASSEEPLFPESQSWWPDSEMVGVVHGAMSSGGQSVSDGRRGWIELRPDAGGLVAVQGLSPRASIELTVHDQLGRVLFERALARLGETEQRREAIVVLEALVELNVRVTDALGDPVAGATLRLAGSDPDGEPLSARADSSGRGDFRGLGAARVSLEVVAEGFTSRSGIELDLRPPASRIHIVLER